MTPIFPSPLLVIEASSSAGSVAVIVDDVVTAECPVVMGPSRDDALLPAIETVLRAAHVAPRDVRAVACGSGPGSFTSLRIAASLAKGIAIANDALLYAVPSMLLAAAALKDQSGSYVLHADALRGERYVVRVSIDADGVVEMSNTARMTLSDIGALANDNRAKLVAVGNAVPELEGLQLQPQARHLALLRAEWNRLSPVSVELWEPDYGRLAEAQVKWETAHGRMLPVS